MGGKGFINMRLGLGAGGCVRAGECYARISRNMAENKALNKDLRLILASNSPRRKELLGLGDWPFEIQAADVDESVLPNEAPRDYVARVAADKARVVAASFKAGWVLAADTSVVLDGAILGKPHNAETARRMLIDLRGREHDVFTALTIINAANGEKISDLARSRVPMRNYSDAEMDAYIASGDPLDKAGAYGIQHQGFHVVEGMAQCFANVVGLPLCHLARTMSKWNFDFGVDIPGVCQAHLDYACPIFEEVLQWEQ
jgi:septum formation protein